MFSDADIRGFALSVEPWQRFVSSRKMDFTALQPLSIRMLPLFETERIGNQTYKYKKAAIIS